MPIPEFIVELRTKIGTDLLWLPGVTAVVVRDDARVLLTRRADTGEWHLVSGIMEPGEQPVETVRREIAEETGVEVVVGRLSSSWSGPQTTVPANGDRLQFLDLCFRCTYVSGDAHVADDENLEVGWFGFDALPRMKASQVRRIELARPVTGEPYFER